MTMQPVITLREPGIFECREEVAPSVEMPGPGDVLTRVLRIGVCGTDIHAFHGRQPFFHYPRVLGHELAVEVVAGDSLPDGLKIGDLCAVEPYLNNPNSQASKRGKSNCCENLEVLGVMCDGGMRSSMILPANKLHRAPGVEADSLALVEMLCIGRHAVERARVRSEDFAVVFGAGPIGMSVLSFLKPKCDRVAVVDLNAGRLDFCKNGLGIERTLELRDDADLASLLKNASGDGTLPSVIFDATGHAGSMMKTFDHVAHGGTIVFVGLFVGDVCFNDPNFHRREITLMSSRNATPGDFKAVVNAIRVGQVDTEPWITHRIALEEVPREFGKVTSAPTLRKAIIDVND